MIHCDSIVSLQKELKAIQNKRIGLVPTMGNLHDGHLSLIDQIRSHCDVIIVTVFVNPSQFGPNEDFDSYPRTLSDDLDLLNDRDIDIAFSPTIQDMYPEGVEKATKVHIPHLSKLYCGKSRPQFFDGVCSIVSRLFLATQADVAIFGEKDFQQLQLIKIMARDLLMNIDILSAPIVREDSGLAMSSRNHYLSDTEKEEASSIYKGLLAMKSAFDAGNSKVHDLKDKLISELKPSITVDYLVIVDSDTLSEYKESCNANSRVLFAGTLGSCRLIDNIIL